MSNGTIVEGTASADIECPFCHSKIVVKADVEILPPNVRKGGSTFHHTDAIASVQCEVKKIKIHHECEPEKGKD